LTRQKYRIQVLSSVQVEVLDALNWYEKINNELSSRLKLEIKSAYKTIVQNPSGFQIRYDAVRLYHLKIFPYSIHYEYFESEKLIKILAFLHQRQKSDSLE
jgi:plasmid stabilization system protein ParE